ncbi:MAG: DUF3373 family protein [Campylobacterota bacterium]
MIKKPLLVSLAAAALLTGANVQAASMFDRMTEMETEMKALQAELAEVKAAKTVAVEADDEAPEDDEAEDAEEEAEEAEESDDEEGEDDEEDEDDEESFEEETEEQLTELNKRTSGNHLKFGVDFRTAVDNLQYTMADGSKQENSAIFTNRLWLNMNWAATSNLSFTGQLAYNKTYGQRSGAEGAAYETFDWITNENAYDDTIRVRSAYFFYRNDTFLGTEIPWTFSVGRRPSTNGHLVNMRDDDTAASPMGHAINVEFDGASAKFTLWEDIGMYAKLCGGRGMTNAAPRFNTAPYATVEPANENIDLVGFIFVPYDDGQYSIGTQYYYANNLIDAVNPMDPSQGMKTVGGLQSFTGNIVVSGIGDEWSDFLDDTTIFVSGAVSITDPNDTGGGMLGATESARGWSGWVGMQFPSLISEEGRWGLEYNKGTKYWRAMTYGEDTLIGSKLAARGDAYEAYFTEPLIDDMFSLQIRYTYIDYKYAGSNGFFGSTTGDSTLLTDLPTGYGAFYVDKAQDIRAYLRYRY